MLSRRVIVCLDVLAGQVVKGIRFQSLVSMGDPASLASRYEADGADEIVFLNIAASTNKSDQLVHTIRDAADRLTIPLTVGGGVSSTEHIEAMLRAGADKVSINSAAVARPSLLTDAAQRFGSQCVIASIDASRDESGWRVYTHGGRMRTPLDAVSWAVECVERGAGEILLTSIDRDGTRSGYDIGLTHSIAEAVSVPVIASGGAGQSEDVIAVLKDGRADAALVAGVLHEGICTVRDIKNAMKRANIDVRLVA
jgi:imidazole glycerol-phosphate synthase subunit HisF